MQRPHDKSINKPIKTKSKLGLAPQALLWSLGLLILLHTPVSHGVPQCGSGHEVLLKILFLTLGGVCTDNQGA